VILFVVVVLNRIFEIKQIDQVEKMIMGVTCAIAVPNILVRLNFDIQGVVLSAPETGIIYARL